jgi:hypothetical protein
MRLEVDFFYPVHLSLRQNPFGMQLRSSPDTHFPTQTKTVKFKLKQQNKTTQRL